MQKVTTRYYENSRKLYFEPILDPFSKKGQWFLYDRGLHHERVKNCSGIFSVDFELVNTGWEPMKLRNKFRVNNKNNRLIYRLSSKLVIKTPEQP